VKQQWISLSEETRSFYLKKWMWSTANLQKFKASILQVEAQELQTSTLLLWHAETAPALYSGQHLDLNLLWHPNAQRYSGILISHVQHRDFYALKALHLIGAIITPDEAQQVRFEMLAFW